MQSMRGFKCMKRGARARRGSVIVYTAISMTVIIGMAALAVDIGSLYSAQSELQRSADAAALAAAQNLAISDQAEWAQNAIDAATQVNERNQVLNHMAPLDENGDIEFGSGNRDAATGRFTFVPNGTPTDAVRVTVRRATGSGGGPIQLAFARMFGHESRDLEARAAAILVPRDFALSLDLSGSMAWDSTLAFWNRNDGGYANTRDVWCALNGPEPSRPYTPTIETASEYASDTGPAIGSMATWGNALIPGSYSASSDPGLWNIRKSYNTTDARVIASLTARGYSADERSILLSKNQDGNATQWRRRAAILIGVASWRSGRTGGFSGGDGDAMFDTNEVTYISYPSYRVSWTWDNFIDYVQGTDVGDSAGTFRYRYGPKTFTDYLVGYVPRYDQTNNLWATPELPQRPIKDAVQEFINVLTDSETLDKCSLEIFATTGRHELNLTTNLQSIADRYYSRQAGHYDTTTNIGAGLAFANTELTSARARPNAKKIIILMSDGLPNIDEAGNYVGDGAAGAVSYARSQAQVAANNNFTIYTVSVGSNADRSLMQEIAAIGGGIEFYAAGSPDEYAEQLRDIFRSLGGNRPVQLIE